MGSHASLCASKQTLVFIMKQKYVVEGIGVCWLVVLVCGSYLDYDQWGRLDGSPHYFIVENTKTMVKGGVVGIRSLLEPKMACKIYLVRLSNSIGYQRYMMRSPLHYFRNNNWILYFQIIITKRPGAGENKRNGRQDRPRFTQDISRKTARAGGHSEVILVWKKRREVRL